MRVSLLSSLARASFPIFPSGHPDRGPDLAPCRAPRRGRAWGRKCRNGHAGAIGCRGFTGPIPPPLWMSVIQLFLKRDKDSRAIPGGSVPPRDPFSTSLPGFGILRRPEARGFRPRPAVAPPTSPARHTVAVHRPDHPKASPRSHDVPRRGTAHVRLVLTDTPTVTRHTGIHATLTWQKGGSGVPRQLKAGFCTPRS